MEENAGGVHVVFLRIQGSSQAAFLSKKTGSGGGAAGTDAAKCAARAGSQVKSAAGKWWCGEVSW